MRYFVPLKQVKQQNTIVLDCERMKYPYTGLYHYCDKLARALIRTEHSEKFCFYLPSSMAEIFGKEQCYIPQTSLHKLFRPSMKHTDLWHCTYQGTDYFPSDKNTRIVMTIHDLNYLNDETKSDEKKNRFKADLQKKIDRTDHIIAISNFTMDDVKKHFDLGNLSHSVIYNGCNIDQVAQLQLPEYIPSREFLFTLGTIVDKKNFHTLPPLLVDNDYELLIAGLTHSTSYKEKILREARKFDVQDRIVFTGAVGENDKQWYLKNCRAFVFPSIAEGFGLPVIEAMYFGKPVFLSTHTCLPEIGGEAAYYFNDFDPQTMRNTLASGLKDHEINLRTSRIIERASQFNWTKAAEQYLQVYRQVLG